MKDNQAIYEEVSECCKGVVLINYCTGVCSNNAGCDGAHDTLTCQTCDNECDV